MTYKTKIVSSRIPERQVELFQDLAKDTGINISELKRRMYDFCFQERVINEIIPSMSGNIQINVR